MKLARSKCPLFRIDAIDGMEVYPLQPYSLAVPIGGRFFHHDFLSFAPRGQVERTVPDERSRLAPRVASIRGRTEFLDAFEMNGVPSHERKLRKEIGGGMLQFHLERARVGRRKPNLFERRKGFVEGFRALDHKKKDLRNPRPATA